MVVIPSKEIMGKFKEERVYKELKFNNMQFAVLQNTI